MSQHLHDLGALESLRREQRFDPLCIRRFRNAHYKRGLPLEVALKELPLSAHSEFLSRFGTPALTLTDREDSERDGASKLIFENHQGLRLETVLLRILSGRTSVCVSSQVGCAAKCAFCATGQMQMARSLSAPDIVEQVVLARQILNAEGRRLRNVVFMGMGEPMHNRAAVTEAIERLRDPRWFDLSENHILVSSVGIVDEMLTFARAMPRVNLALSLHAARQEVREVIMPLARQTHVEDLRRMVLELQKIQQKRIMLEVLLLENINDGEEDVAALLAFCEGIEAHVNLIPYNEVSGARLPDGTELRGTGPARRLEISSALKSAGLRVTTRASLGDDIAAACGQLVKKHKLAELRRSSHRS